jgi:hypothetical protein
MSEERPTDAPPREPSEEELRAAYEAEIKQIRVEHVLLEHVVTVVNLGMRRTGLAPGTESERDPGQVRMAIEAIRTLLPLLEQALPQQVAPVREALSQLQLAFVKIGGAGADHHAADEQAAPQAGQPGAAREQQPPPAPKPSEPGPAQRSGKLWVPGQR